MKLSGKYASVWEANNFLFPGHDIGLLPKPGQEKPVAAQPPKLPSPPSIFKTSSEITQPDLIWRGATLADDSFEGRKTGTPGGKRAADWIAAEMQRIGLKPGVRIPGKKPSYFQKFLLMNATKIPENSSFSIRSSQGSLILPFTGKDAQVQFWSPRYGRNETKVEAPMVFVGYGVNAPEKDWNDYAGVNIQGKVVVMLNNGPGNETDDKALFDGKAITKYDRWDYKLEEAARQGAAGVILIHENKTADRKWENIRSMDTWAETRDRNESRAGVEAWVNEETARRLINSANFNGKNLDFDELKKAANIKGFKAIPLMDNNQQPITLAATVRSKVEEIEACNVIGELPGKNKKRKDEKIIFSAHYDHLGMDKKLQGDQIYNGFIDNATGASGMMEVAEKFVKDGKPEDRTLVFAMVDDEEKGMLGSQYHAASLEANKVKAGVNVDTLLPHGPGKDVIVLGHSGRNRSDLEDIWGETLAEDGMTIARDPLLNVGLFYRTDHMSYVKKGIPFLPIWASLNYEKGGETAGLAGIHDYFDNFYHKPQDEPRQNMDFSGAVKILNAVYRFGKKIANPTDMRSLEPNWRLGNEFRAIRDESLRQKT